MSSIPGGDILHETQPNIAGNDADARLSRLILDTNPLAITVLDQDFEFIDCNEAALRLFEASSKSEYLQNHFMFMPPIQPSGMFSGDAAREIVSDLLNTGEVIAHWLYKNKSGGIIPCEITLRMIHIDDTNLIILYTRDLRDEIEAQAQVREVTERNRIMIDASPICFVFFDDSFQVVDCNPAALSLFGMPDIETFADKFFALCPDCQDDGIASFDGYREIMQKTFNGGQMNFEWNHLTANGELLPVDTTFVRVEYKGSYRIAGYLRDLREHNAVLEEMQRAERKLREAKELAEDSARTKSEFLANMSHEIRTPMNGIIGITNLALRNETSDTQRDYLEKIDQSAKSLLRILDDILDFSKIEAGRLEIEQAEFRIDAVLNDIRNITAYAILQKGIEFSVNTPEELTYSVIGDSLRLKQVLLNITSNAIKFTEKGGVTISVEITDRKEDTVALLFSITDSGIGMTEVQVSRVFAAFGQADTSTSRKYGGTGLGLAISKSLVELMGGRIWLESEPGVGTTFRFTAEFEIAFFDGTQPEAVSDSDDYIIPEQLIGSKLLLVEDNEINRLIATELLGSAGFEIDIAVNGLEAVHMVEKNKYDLILMDVQMPEMDGFESTRIIRSDSRNDEIPIIAMTANAMQGDREKSLESGMDDHITKPLMPRTLMETICNWLLKQ